MLLPLHRCPPLEYVRHSYQPRSDKHESTILALSLVVTVVGCASSTENLQRETARSLGNVAPEAVAVTNVSRGVTSVSWEANSPKGAYSCSADDMVRRVHCVKK